MSKTDPEVLGMVASLARINATLLSIQSTASVISESRRKALRDIEDLIADAKPADLDEARELLQQVRDRIEAAMGGMLTKDVI